MGECLTQDRGVEGLRLHCGLELDTFFCLVLKIKYMYVRVAFAAYMYKHFTCQCSLPVPLQNVGPDLDSNCLTLKW